MAINWSNEYENQPRNKSNPGFIAQSVRTLKTAVRERLVYEHFFGAAEGTDIGKHREGGARIFVDDAETRTDTVTNDQAVGRTVVDLNELGTQPDIDGVAQTGILANILSVYDKDNVKQTVFDQDDFVHKSWDQDITGRKRYTSINPEVQEALDDTTYDAMDATTKVRADEKAVKRSGIKVWTEDAKSHNIFDAADSYNDVSATTEGDTNPITGTAETTDNSISADIIYANLIYGAAYS